MSEWYWSDGQNARGPCGTAELRQLVAAGTVTVDTMLWREGMADWVRASRVTGLFAGSPAGAPGPPPPRPVEGVAMPGGAALHAGLATAQGQAASLLSDLRSLNFREEVVPIDESNFQRLMKDYIFWGVTLMGVTPLLIGTLDRSEYQLTAFALFFAMLWGVIFKYFIVRQSGAWGLLLASLFVTGVAGIFLLLWSYEHVLPTAFLNLYQSKTGMISLFGFIFHVGVFEELTKAAPVIAYLLWSKERADPATAVMVGVFSGLGFAAFENMHYGDQSVSRSFALTRDHGVEGLVAGVKGAMVNVMLRSLSLVFVHALWAGIVAYFLAIGHITGKRRAALFLVGLMVAAVLHGVYDWLQGVQSTFAALVVAVSFVLFYAYLSKLRGAIAPREAVPQSPAVA